jgi:cysteine synthase
MPHTTIVEASSGSTAISEAYFARLLGLPFLAVVPKGTARRKLDEIAFHGGVTREVPGGDVYRAADADTVFDAAWLATCGLPVVAWRAALEAAAATMPLDELAVASA